MIVKGNAQTVIVLTNEGIPLIADHDLRLQLITMVSHEFDFLHDLTLTGNLIKNQIVEGSLVVHVLASFVTDAMIFFLDFKEYLIAQLRITIAAQSQFLLIGRFVQRSTDEPVIRRIEIDAADVAVRIDVSSQMIFHDCHQLSILLSGDQVFGFNSFKDTLVIHRAYLL